MIVVWRQGVPFIRCRPGEFAPDADPERNAAVLLADLRRWGMTYANIAEAIDVDADRVRNWAARQISPHGGVYFALERLHHAAEKAIAHARGQ